MDIDLCRNGTPAGNGGIRQRARHSLSNDAYAVTLLVATDGAMVLVIGLLLVVSRMLTHRTLLATAREQVLAREQVTRAQAEAVVRLQAESLAVARRFRTLVEEAPTAISIKDAYGRSSAETQHPDMILLDIMMPGMDGVEVSQRLRADPGTASIPIVVMSAQERLHSTGRGMPVDDSLPKPFELRRLYATVVRWAALA